MGVCSRWSSDQWKGGCSRTVTAPKCDFTITIHFLSHFYNVVILFSHPCPCSFRSCNLSVPNLCFAPGGRLLKPCQDCSGKVAVSGWRVASKDDNRGQKSDSGFSQQTHSIQKSIHLLCYMLFLFFLNCGRTKWKCFLQASWEPHNQSERH